MIKNIGTKLGDLQVYLTGLNISVPIYAGKPPKKEGKYIWFGLSDNSAGTTTDREGQYILTKEAVLEFYFVGETDTADQDLYEILDKLSNKLIIQNNINLGDFDISSIEEGPQSGVLREESERPYIVGAYIFKYKYYYE